MPLLWPVRLTSHKIAQLARTVSGRDQTQSLTDSSQARHSNRFGRLIVNRFCQFGRLLGLPITVCV